MSEVRGEKHGCPAWDIRRYESIDSTNLEARRLIAAGSSPGLVVTARHQTGGRGRMGRDWLDLPGKSLMVSLVLQGGGFGDALLVSISIRAAIVSAGGEGPGFKWPNDLVYGSRKVGGILSESCSAEAGEYVIVGLGLNVGYLPGELDIPARIPPTSLLIEEGRTWDIEELLQGLLRELEVRWGRGREEWLREYRENLAYVDKRVRVIPPFSILDGEVVGTGEVEGIMQGVDDEGNLLLAIDGGTVRLATGDVEEMSG